MTVPAAPDFQLVSTPSALHHMVSLLSSEPSLALDMEMENNYHHYGLHVALVQISTLSGRHFLVDPLAGLELDELGRLLANRQIQLILHDAVFDQHAARQVLGWELRNIFDTKIAAQLCGHRQFGLAHLLAEYFGVALDKRYQKTNWMKRPLPPEALAYAANDTAYLHALRDKLMERLVALGRMSWAEEEFRRLVAQVDQTPEKPLHLRMKRSALLTPRQRAVLKQLVELRERLAREVNRPPHFIMRNETMLALAARPMLTLADVAQLSGLHPVLRRPAGAAQLLAAWRAGQAAVEEHFPRSAERRPRPTPESKKRLKDMQAWRAARAAELDIEPYLLLDNDVLAWCALRPHAPLAPEIAALVRGWQRALCWADFAARFSIPAL